MKTLGMLPQSELRDVLKIINGLLFAGQPTQAIALKSQDVLVTQEEDPKALSDSNRIQIRVAYSRLGAPPAIPVRRRVVITYPTTAWATLTLTADSEFAPGMMSTQLYDQLREASGCLSYGVGVEFLRLSYGR